MTRVNIIIALLCFSLCGLAQSYNMPYTGNDTTTQCSGTLYDHAGPLGNYSNGSNGYFYLNPAGGTLSISLVAFNTENCCDRLYVYDGIGTAGTLLGSYRGTILPNGGNPIAIPSGKATLRFYSDGSVTRSGFELTWLAGGGTAPVASFTVPSTTVPVNVGVNFTNTSTGSATPTWHFGDGDTSNVQNAVHAYSSPGTYSAYLITTDCFGSDTSASQIITVMPSPVYTIAPDSIYLTVNCGSSFDASLLVSNTAGGTMQYGAKGQDNNGNAIIFQERFESGLGAFSVSPSASASFSANAVLGGANSSNGGLLINGYTSNFNGVSASYSSAQADEISYYVKPTNNNYHGEIGFGENSSLGYNMLFYSRLRYGFLYLYTGVGTYTYAVNDNQWNKIEVKNIDWINHTFDLYVNSISVATGLVFYDQFITGLNDVYIWNSNNVSCSFDEIKVSHVAQVPFTATPNIGTVAVAGTDSIQINGSAAGMLAGLYNYNVKVNTNATGVDSVSYIPLVLNVIGAPAINFDQACVSLDSIFSVQTKVDSILIYNPGCDSLNISSITSTNSDFALNMSAVALAPFDSTYLEVTFSPSVLGAYIDTIHLINNATDTSICLSAFVVGAPSISTDSLSYTINSIGCNDSIPFSFEIINSGASSLTWNIVAGGSGNFTDDFESGLNTNIWQSIGSMTIGSGCFSNSGSNALMVVGTNRFAVTVPFNVGANDSVKFWVAPASGACETPDGGEYLNLEYSLNGSTWINMGTVLNNQTAGFVSFPIPPLAVSTATQFRLAQTSYSGSGYDEYMVDDFSIGTTSGGSFQPALGTTSANDTVQITGYFSTVGLSSGTYVRTVTIQSNDPTDSVYHFTVNIVVQGLPWAVVPNSCLQFDTTMSSASSLDSVLIFNVGCEDLNISSLAVSTSNFTVLSAAGTVSPGDSMYVSVQFNPGATLGLLVDTLVISSNDTFREICLSGFAIGAPLASVSPDSIYTSFNSCNDSITIPVTLYNTGLGVLNFEVNGNVGNAGLNVVLYQYGASGTELANVLQILNTMPNINLVLSSASTVASFNSDLANADVLILPEASSMLSFIIPEVQAFCANGGGLVHLQSNNSLYTQLAIFPVSGSYSSFTSGSINNLMPSHPIMSGIPTSFSAQNASVELVLTGTTANILARRGIAAADRASVFSVPYGSGTGVFIGFDYYQYSTETSTILKQAVKWSAQGSLPDFLTVSPDSGLVATSDSVMLNVKISTSGLQNGRHSGDIVISTNDPLNPEIIIPVVVDVNGQGQTELLTVSCVNFDSTLVGAAAMDSVWLKNIGCDTLLVTSASSSSGDYNLLFGPYAIAPGDSSGVIISFSPSIIGTINDTLFFHSNADTTSICVTGKGIGAPVTIVNPDTLRVRLNTCKNFTIENLSITNQGQGAMNYDVQFGDLYQDTSLAFYNTSGAVTNHVFNNTPSSADTVWFTVVVNGDFDGGGEVYSVSVEGTNLGNNFVQFLTIGNNDTARFYYAGPNISTWLADNTLNVTITNASSVNPGFTNALDMHFVEVSIGSSSPPWLSLLSPATGNSPVGSTVNKNLLFTAGSLPLGQYTTSILVKTNDPVNPVVRVPVIFDLVDEPEISISDTCLYYPTTFLGDTTIRSFWVFNNGCSNLNLSSVLSLSASFKVSPSSGMVLPGDSILVSVSFIPASANSFNSSAIINNNDTTQMVCLRAISLAKVVANFNYTIQDSCTGEVLFIDHSLFTPTGYFWDFGDGTTSTLGNVTHTFAKPGTYKVLLTVSNSAGNDTLSALITVNPLYVGFSMTNDTTLINKMVNFYDSSIVATAWRWNFGDGNTSTIANPTHTYLNLGNYNVTLEVDDAKGCTRSIVKNIHVIDDVGLFENSFNSISIKVFPNPSSGVFNLEIEQDTKVDYELMVYDFAGKAVWIGSTLSDENKTIDLSDFSDGVYQLFILKDGAIKAARKLIVQ